MTHPVLNNNSLAFIALCNEYCQALETVSETDKNEFVKSMLKILPRLYIAASDIKENSLNDDDFYIENILEEDYYDSIRRNIEYILGYEDSYLEVFEEDMKYSDTPIAASISEGLCDIFQSLYNFIETIKNAPEELTSEALVSIHDDFKTYWSRILCNVLRALNHIRYNEQDQNNDY